MQMQMYMQMNPAHSVSIKRIDAASFDKNKNGSSSSNEKDKARQAFLTLYGSRRCGRDGLNKGKPIDWCRKQ